MDARFRVRFRPEGRSKKAEEEAGRDSGAGFLILPSTF
jgi:hypothetical protein